MNQYKKYFLFTVFFLAALTFFSSSFRKEETNVYLSRYRHRIQAFKIAQQDLLNLATAAQSLSTREINGIREKIKENRLILKSLDFWLRYLEPIAYKRINGPLPVEWETEVFEKWEPPYKREGYGLTLAETYLDETEISKDSLLTLIEHTVPAADIFLQDSITHHLETYNHFFLANRLFILNLAAIYTTGFECPDTESVIPELLHMLKSVKDIYAEFDSQFPTYRLKDAYLNLFDSAISHVNNQPRNPEDFDHFTFIQQYVNPLYRMNAEMIREYNVRSSNFNDYSLNRDAVSIFDKSLYRGQNTKGVYISSDNEEALKELRAAGKMLFYDPILSGNNKRSCASCHKPEQYFTDTTVTTHFQFDQKSRLNRNTPSLVNAVYNHLLMLDGRHTILENQALDVMTNPEEMGSRKEEIVKKVLSCDDYKKVFKKHLNETPQYESVNWEHIASALVLYFSDFSLGYSPFDRAMNQMKEVPREVKNGFNVFMSKAQCGTCHFIPQFNGVKPPYVGSEFEVIGVPQDKSLTRLSADKGRYKINPAPEMESAFRTGTLRNAAYTKPYMHNGVFNTLEEVIDFYDAGGGMGKGLNVPNQTLSSDSLKLTPLEKKELLAFIFSLNEEIPIDSEPEKIPQSKIKALNARLIGGEY